MSKVNKFRKKPVVIEAMQWTGDNLDALKEWGAPVTYLPASNRPNLGHALIIGTLEDGPNSEAIHIADYLDWIIKGVKEEFYPCKPDIFEMTYEKIPEGMVLYNNAPPAEDHCPFCGDIAPQYECPRCHNRSKWLGPAAYKESK